MKESSCTSRNKEFRAGWPGLGQIWPGPTLAGRSGQCIWVPRLGARSPGCRHSSEVAGSALDRGLKREKERKEEERRRRGREKGKREKEDKEFRVFVRFKSRF